MLAKQQAKVGRPGASSQTPVGIYATQDTGHNLHLTMGFSCHGLTGDDKTLLVQSIRDSPGKIVSLPFTCGHRPCWQASPRSPDEQDGWGFGQVFSAFSLWYGHLLRNICSSTGNHITHGNRWQDEAPHPTAGKPALAGSVDEAGGRQLQISIFAQELHRATLKYILKCLLNRALHSPALGVQGVAEIGL